MRAMSNAPKPLLGEGEGWAQDNLGALFGEGRRAFRNLGFVANVEAYLGKG